MQTRIICIYKLHYHRYLVVRVGAQVINVILEYDDVEELMATGLPIATDDDLQQYINADTDLWYKIEAEKQEQYWKEHQDELEALKEEYEEDYDEQEEGWDELYQDHMDECRADEQINRQKDGAFDELPF